MTKNFKNPHKKQNKPWTGKHGEKSEVMDTTSRMKDHFPDRIWGVPNENKNKKGPKV